MAKWEKLRSGISKVAGKTIRKTEEVAENATMYVKLSSLRSARDKHFTALGRLVYKQTKTGNSQSEAIAKTIVEIDKANAAVAKQKAKIENYKEEKERKRLERQLAEEEMEKFEEQALVSEVQVVVENTPMGEPVNFEEM
jgi:hypothetical protein